VESVSQGRGVMKIDAIARLFSANSESYKAQTTTNADQTAKAASSEAVKVNSTFGKAQGEHFEGDRQEKIATLKKLVSSGGYTPNSRDVAIALAKELFA